MLNRTNRKLSAKNLGLNLGTRSLAVKAGANLDKLTRRCVGMMHLARVDGSDRRGSFWLDSIFIGSYPPIASATSMPIGSSPETQPSTSRGWAEGTTGQIAALASLTSASLLHLGVDRRRAFRPMPQPRLPLGLGKLGRIMMAQQQPLPRNQVPDATP